MPILTPDQMRKEHVWNQIQNILKAANLQMAPKVCLHTGGMSFEIDLIDVGRPAGTVVPGGKADG